ncbi:MAG TPA: LPXTG cell wall anchor domain-containing protein [Streptosporangiaceae bacterium]
MFISTNHDLRATASFIVGVLALAAGGFMLVRKPKNT